MTIDEFLSLPPEEAFKVDLTQVDSKDLSFEELLKKAKAVPIEDVYKEIFGKELDNNSNK